MLYNLNTLVTLCTIKSIKQHHYYCSFHLKTFNNSDNGVLYILFMVNKYGVNNQICDNVYFIVFTVNDGVEFTVFTVIINYNWSYLEVIINYNWSYLEVIINYNWSYLEVIN